MTISTSFKRFWPADRLQRLKTLQAAARKAGLRLVARNGGDRRIFLPYIAFWKDGDREVISFWNIGEAERWLQEGGK
ncbi:hypothetical protein [Mesorhizobium onobrychidis]|uniref:Uncharacterized protein n=1 Tax=Mesorhizobium onobrychidis TaxID=2775404 RepID=A0ABY5QNV5_9HYPH|nr:hypothetical protein [Mesorhizobium onobrychidis]UVC12840.1 hypothetical protein IHQ72_18890 [Mesorhizobium onobrychidis]